MNLLDNSIAICGTNETNIYHSLILLGIALSYYWFGLQLIRLIFSKGELFKHTNIKMVLSILTAVFVLCGNSKLLGCAGNLINDSFLFLCQVVMIIIIELNFSIIINIKTQNQVNEILKKKKDEFDKILDKIKDE